MGNWRSVKIVGSCDASEVRKLKDFINCSNYDDFDNFCPLSFTGGLVGLPLWPAKHIDATGNLAERGYDEDSVAECLNLLAKIAPSLKLKVHMGGDDEDKKCVATVVLENGKVEIDEPQIDKIGEVSKSQATNNLMAQLQRRR
jgi:hypothetical protein